MKKIIPAIIGVLIGAFGLNSYADNANAVVIAGKTQGGTPATVKMLTVDAGELYAKYNKAIEAREKFNQAAENTKKEINDMIQEGMKIGEAYNELQAKANNPALTEAAKKKFLEESNEKVKQIEDKQRQILEYQQQAEDALMQRNQSVTNLHLHDMKEVCAKIAKEKGADLVLNTTGVLVMYADDKSDITKEAIEVLNARK